ncbi:phage tail protein [Aquimarina longa]|uniref:phage tail protein n=1 Tax=Aquimarina longa TaxID=1080221 RepID=UPI00078235BB|nr:phage tail protein [Aquimarina longa]
MPQQFPYSAHRFGVYFLSPLFRFDAGFQSVNGLGFSYESETHAEGGISGYSHNLTNRGSYNNLTLSRGFTKDQGLYLWCEATHNTMQTMPANILVSLLDNQGLPIKNWLIFHAIPKSWSPGDLEASTSKIMVESVSFSYQSFILI